MYGLWNATQATEKIEQSEFTRHQILMVNCGVNLFLPWNPTDASGMASEDPNAISVPSHNLVTDKGAEGGPHFIMSPETTTASKSYGFQFCLFDAGLFGADVAEAGVGGYTVTVWVLVENIQPPNGNAGNSGAWASLLPVTGVLLNEMYHSFDVNASAVRFQIGNLAEDPTTVNKSIGIAFAEL